MSKGRVNFAVSGIEPPKRVSRLPSAPPAPVEAPDNLTKPSEQIAATLQDMNFKVRPDFHTRFKVEASIRGMSMKELLEACFQAYVETHGSKGGL